MHRILSSSPTMVKQRCNETVIIKSKPTLFTEALQCANHQARRDSHLLLSSKLAQKVAGEKIIQTHDNNLRFSASTWSPRTARPQRRSPILAVVSGGDRQASQRTFRLLQNGARIHLLLTTSATIPVQWFSTSGLLAVSRGSFVCPVYGRKRCYQ